jgi:hypothetical protein
MVFRGDGMESKFSDQRDLKRRATVSADALAAMALSHPKKALALAREAVANRKSEVRIASIEILDALGSRRDVSRLLHRLQDPDWLVRSTAAEALGRFGSRRVVRALAAALHTDPNLTVRRFAAWALGEVGSPAAVLALKSEWSRRCPLRVRAVLVDLIAEFVDPDVVHEMPRIAKASRTYLDQMEVVVACRSMHDRGISDQKQIKSILAALDHVSSRAKHAWLATFADEVRAGFEAARGD